MGDGTYHMYNVSAPVMLGLGLLVAGLVAFLWYTTMDNKLEKSEGIKDEVSEEDKFKFSDILFIIKNKGFWLIALIMCFVSIQAFSHFYILQQI
jgi:hypothetical protein